jgi:hypothetical protein
MTPSSVLQSPGKSFRVWHWTHMRRCRASTRSVASCAASCTTHGRTSTRCWLGWPSCRSIRCWSRNASRSRRTSTPCVAWQTRHARSPHQRWRCPLRTRCRCTCPPRSRTAGRRRTPQSSERKWRSWRSRRCASVPRCTVRSSRKLCSATAASLPRQRPSSSPARPQASMARPATWPSCTGYAGAAACSRRRMRRVPVRDRSSVKHKSRSRSRSR